MILKISGGLGNQMFQYAFGKSLALKRKEKLKLEIFHYRFNNFRLFLLDNFQLYYQEAYYYKLILIPDRYIKRYVKLLQTIGLFSNIYLEQDYATYDKNIRIHSKYSYFLGYFQSFKYFEEIRDELLKDFSVKNLDKQNRSKINEINSTNSISLHVRRGDYIYHNGLNICDIKYFENAISLIIKKVKKPHFFIFSDDIEWVKKNIKINYSTDYINFNSNYPERDIELMKKCKHNIISNSTFSWWGAWLNENPNKIVITPKMWTKDRIAPIDLIPSTWIKI